jgi:drug/metabolite transporter (DMT)-like permease
LWGSAFVGIRAAGEALAPGSIALGRLLVSTAILTGVALVRRERLPDRSAWLPIAVFGVLFLGGYSVTLNAAERRVDAGTAAMLVNTGPLLIAVLAGIFLREGFARTLLAGCCVASAGAAVIGLATAGARASTGLGLVLLVGATLMYASAVVVQKAALTRASAFQVTWLGCGAATLACLPFAPTLATQIVDADSSAIAWTVYLGAMPTALGFATWSFALGRASAGRVASLNYLIPIVAVVLGWAYLGERPPLRALAGGALCLAGVYLARRPPRSSPCSCRSRGTCSTSRFAPCGRRSGRTRRRPPSG